MTSGLTDIPTPSSLSYVWSFGSLLGIFLVVQLFSGVFLSFYYSSSVDSAFSSVVIISEEINYGWLLRSIHANGASFFFLLMFAHIGRGIYFKSFNNLLVWVSGVLILSLSIGSAFLGYVLPWGQISYWGATVITNLLSVFPFGEEAVEWVWGGFTVSGPTLSRFFSLHFLLPFVISVFVIFHIYLLHEKGSSNPLGVAAVDADKVFFHPLYSVKDLLGLMAVLLLFVTTCVIFSDLFIDPDNFTPANSIVTPVHIQPEWYFLFAYAILRSIPSKLGGVIALSLAILVLFLLPLLSKEKSLPFGPKKIIFWAFVAVFILLTWIGSLPAEGVLVNLGQVLSVSYFSLAFLIPVF